VRFSGPPIPAGSSNFKRRRPLLASKHLTGLYLFALAASHQAKLATLDRRTFFHLGEGDGSFGELGCSREFLDLAQEAGWTGFSFHPLDAIGISFRDFRSRPWPPTLWYPEGQPD